MSWYISPAAYCLSIRVSSCTVSLRLCVVCQRPEGVALPQEADDQICRTAAEHGQNGVRLELTQGNESGGEDQDADPVDRGKRERTIREADQFQDG